ncbi:hypothetical protein N5F13_00105 [Comamonas thiooxydans]|nr:hypothetical protein [Comamonas thiooxydans]MDH1255043.1 hypothetical protein [Comamonas thiooxydans]MDH1472883.1 hypothetical protein [Comamonas thiooxydans]
MEPAHDKQQHGGSRGIPVKQDLRQEHPDRQSIEQARHADIVAHLSRG